MHNQLYETQSAWESASADERTSIFLGYAKQLGINADTFTKDLAGNAINQKISFDQALGKKIGVNATPSLYLDNKAVAQDVWTDEAKFDQAIQTELKKYNIALPTDSTK
jgi:protein-disulfide isomerase